MTKKIRQNLNFIKQLYSFFSVSYIFVDIKTFLIKKQLVL